VVLGVWAIEGNEPSCALCRGNTIGFAESTKTTTMQLALLS